MKKLTIVMLVLVMALSMTMPVSANSAEPPGMTIISTNLPEDAVITLVLPDSDEIEYWRYRRIDIAWESQYKLWFRLTDVQWENVYIHVASGEKSFTCLLPEAAKNRYNSILTLDYAAQTLVFGQNPWRQPLLTALRMSLTLLVEGAIFFAFGFRMKESWIVFLLLNLLTQGWLNIVINSYAFTNGYWILVLYLIEFVIFLGEALAVFVFVKEHKRWKRIVYSVSANGASLAVGMVLISNLPI